MYSAWARKPSDVRRLSGMYQMPWAVNVSAFYNARQGYPFEPFVRVR